MICRNSLLIASRFLSLQDEYFFKRFYEQRKKVSHNQSCSDRSMNAQSVRTHFFPGGWVCIYGELVAARKRAQGALLSLALVQEFHRPPALSPTVAFTRQQTYCLSLTLFPVVSSLSLSLSLGLRPLLSRVSDFCIVLPSPSVRVFFYLPFGIYAVFIYHKILASIPVAEIYIFSRRIIYLIVFFINRCLYVHLSFHLRVCIR